MDVTTFNNRIIEEFRANQGIVGGQFAGAKLLLLHSTGAKSGMVRVNPLAYFEDGDTFLIVASYQGSSANPPWFHNLVANPAAKIEVGSAEFGVVAAVIEEPARTNLYAQIAAKAPAFAKYQEKTTRQIPVVRLTRAE